jgi:hypothetical protein
MAAMDFQKFGRSTRREGKQVCEARLMVSPDAAAESGLSGQ